MSSDPNSNAIDPFFDAPKNVQFVTDPNGNTRIVETRTITTPNVITTSTPGAYTYSNVATTETRALGPSTSYVTYSGGATAQPRVSNVTFQNAVNQRDVVTSTTAGATGGQYFASSSGATGGQYAYTTTAVDDANFFGGGGVVTTQPTVVRVETTTTPQPVYVTSNTTTTRVVEQPAFQTYTTVTKTEQPVQVTKTIVTTTETKGQSGYQTGGQASNINVVNTYDQNTPLIQNNKDSEYIFYDGDVEDVHTEAPASDGSALCGMLGGLLALLAALALVGLMGAIWHRTFGACFKSVPLAHLIMACLAVAAAAFGIWVCLSSRKAIANHLDLNHTMISIALLLALIFFAYFLASAVWMYMFRPFHYADLSAQKCGNNNQWNSTFDKNTSFESGWGTDRRILWWVALLSIVAAIGFLILAIALWVLTKFTVQSARIILAAACFAGVLLACFGITYFLQARAVFTNNYALRDFKFSYLTTLLALLGIGGIILILNAIWNLLKKRSGHFIFGTILIIFVFVFVCFLGLMLRAFRETQFNALQKANNGSCRDLIANFNASCFKDYCPGGKYLAAGVSCSKEFQAASWETDGSLRYINPCCCNTFMTCLLSPIYYAAIMSLLFIMAVIIAIAANYYLSDTSEYLEFSDRKFGIFELVFLVGIVLTLIAFGFYWGFRPKDNVCPQNPNDPQINRDQFGNIISYKDPNFVPVDLNKVYNGTVPPSAYIQGAVRYNDPTIPVTLAQQTVDLQTANSILNLNANQTACGTANCGWRMGVLVNNGKIANNYNANIQGTSAARGLFFIDNNSNNDFVLLKGTQAEVQQALNELKVNAIDISKPTQVFFNGQQVDLLSLNANGLQANEVLPPNLALDPNGNSFSGAAGYNVLDLGSNNGCFVSNTCQSSLTCGNPNGPSNLCQAGFNFYSSNGLINVAVPIQARDVNGNLVAYDGNSLKSNSYFVHQNTQYPLLNPTISNGQLNFQIPRPLGGSVNMVLNVNDDGNQYLPYSRYAIIPADAVSPYTLEPIQLLTKSGAGCIGAADPAACFANQQARVATLRIVAADPETGAKLAGVPVKLLSGIDGVRTLVSNNTDANGVATFNNVAYDYYTVQFDGNTNYLPSRALLAVQDAKSANYTLNLHQRGSGNTILQQFVSNKNADQDFSLNIANANGTSCNVSPYNKYCGYASHINDVEDYSQGFENIRIYNFTESNYLAYLQNNAPSAQTCGAYDLSQFNYYPNGVQASVRSLSFDWDNVRKAQVLAPTYQTLYCFNGWGLNTIRYYQTAGNAFTSATVCDQFWPAGHPFSLQALRAANSRK